MKIIAALTAALLTSTAFGGDTIVWNEVAASSSGSKIVDDSNPATPVCQKFNPNRPELGGVQFIANGDTMSVLFSGVNINLGSNNRSGRASCRVVIPARVAKGIYFAELQEDLTYGIVKSAGAEAKIFVSSKFAGWQVPGTGFTLTYPKGHGTEVNIPSDTITNISDWTQNSGRFCGMNRNGISVNYIADFVMQGIKDNWSDTLIMSVDGLDLRYSSTLEYRKCDLR
jgi:hypothetical protein